MAKDRPGAGPRSNRSGACPSAKSKTISLVVANPQTADGTGIDTGANTLCPLTSASPKQSLRLLKSDADILMALELQAMGHSAATIAGHLSRHLGRYCPSAAVADLLRQIAAETDASDATGFGNGTLAPGWWRMGLLIRASQAGQAARRPRAIP